MPIQQLKMSKLLHNSHINTISVDPFYLTADKKCNYKPHKKQNSPKNSLQSVGKRHLCISIFCLNTCFCCCEKDKNLIKDNTTGHLPWYFGCVFTVELSSVYTVY